MALIYAGFAEKMWTLCCNAGHPVMENIVYQLFLVLCRHNEPNFTQLIAVTFTTVRPVARISQQGDQKSQGGACFLNTMLHACSNRHEKSRLRHVNFIHIYLDPESYKVMNAEPAENRDVLFCNLGKGRIKK